MRTFLSLLAGVAVLGAVLKYRERQSAAPAPSVAATEAAEPAAKHWPKQALNRAEELKAQVGKQRQDAAAATE